jgi:hypothetical protein
MWAVLHESRSDWAQLLTAAFLMLVGPGRWSLDAWLALQRDEGADATPNIPPHSVTAP